MVGRFLTAKPRDERAWVLDPPRRAKIIRRVLSTHAPYETADVEFDADGTTLRGWLYRPRGGAAAFPAVVMAHGYNCIKELYLDRYAAAVAKAGHVVLAYDHRNFGDSDGEPRQELDPWIQVRDYRNAITFVQTLEGVDPKRIGIWGTSYAGGHVLVVAAIDRRVRCVVAQVPTISGWQSTLRRIAPQMLPGQRGAWEADRLERYKGNPPKIVPMVVDPAAGGAASRLVHSIPAVVGRKRVGTAHLNIEVFEAPGVEQLFPDRDGALSYASSRMRSRSGEVRIISSAGTIEEVFSFAERSQ